MRRYLLRETFAHLSQRFVDRDMVLRYHWGEGIGHAYAHSNDYCGINYVIRNSETVATDLQNNNGIGVREAVDLENDRDDEDELMLKDREELDWDDEISMAGEIEEGLELDDLGSDPDWVDDD